MIRIRRTVRTGSATAAFAATALIASTAQAGGLLLYEFGTGEPGNRLGRLCRPRPDASTAYEPGRHDTPGRQAGAGGRPGYVAEYEVSPEGAIVRLGRGDGGRPFG